MTDSIDATAGLPASSWITFPSAAVTVISRPSGAAPCDTHGSISTPCRCNPTAPLARTPSPHSSMPAPLAERPLASAPSTGTHGASSAIRSSTEAVGNVYGSDSMISPLSVPKRGIPVSISAPSRSATVAWNGSAEPRPPSDAPQIAIAEPRSYS